MILPGGTESSCGVGAHLTSARPVSVAPTMTSDHPRPSPRHSACAPAAHSPLLLFVSPLHSAARSTGTIATIEDGIVGGSPAGCGIFLDGSELLSLLPLLLPVTARRPRAARRRSWRLWRRSSEAARTRRFRRAARASLVAQATLRRCPRRPRVAAAAAEKIVGFDAFFLSSGRACVVGACTAGKSQLSAFQRYRGLWGFGVVLGREIMGR